MMACLILADANPTRAQAPSVSAEDVMPLTAPPAGPIGGSDAAACAAGSARPAVLLTVSAFDGRRGKLRIDRYGDDPDEFLAGKKKLEARGKSLYRVYVPVPAAGDANICIPLPGPGRYALFILHDRDNDDSVGVFSDGFAFSRNPKLGFAKPKLAETLFAVPSGLYGVKVRLLYASRRESKTGGDR